MSYLWNPVPTPTFTTTGAFASGALAYFYVGSSSTPLTVYRDSAMLSPHTWPVVASLTGVFPPIYIPYGTYRVRVLDANGALISDASGIDNPAPPSGGGGIVVTANQIFQTGFQIPMMRTGALSGFVRMNGQTLGNTSSLATEYAAADAADLFAFLWGQIPDSIAPVSGGRGASAAADFAANKTIVIPTWQGYGASGVDDMGAAAAGRLQAITTCSPTGASAIVPVASATGIAVGQNVIINGVSAGVVTLINGLNITLSVIPAAGANVSWRSSFFSDAQQIGAAAGAANLTLTTDQIPSHTHAPTWSKGIWLYEADPGAFDVNFVINRLYPRTAAQLNATPPLSIASTGGGHPAPNLQPTRLVTWYIKL